MRFVLDNAPWLPRLVKKVLKKSEARRINSKGEFVMTSVRSAAHICRPAALLTLLCTAPQALTALASSRSCSLLCAVQERTRTQESNLADCIDKLFDCIVRAAEVDGVTSPETIQRIQRLSAHSHTLSGTHRPP